MNKPRWSDGRELVLIDWLTRKENFDRYNSYLKSNKRNMQGPLLMEIEEEMKRNRKTRTLNQISQHLNKLLKRYRDTVDFLQEARLVGGVLPTMGTYIITVSHCSTKFTHSSLFLR